VARDAHIVQSACGPSANAPAFSNIPLARSLLISPRNEEDKMKQHHRITVAAVVLAALFSIGCSATEHRRAGTSVADTSAFPVLTIVRGEPSGGEVVLVVSDDIFVERLELKASAQRDLAAVAGYLRQHPEQKLVVASAAESPSTDMTRRRAATVEAYFLKSGFDPERVRIKTADVGRPVGIAAVTAPESRQSTRAPASARNTL
jgi:hypothetical protein